MSSDGGVDCAAAGVSENDHQLHAPLEMLHGVVEAAHGRVTDDVSSQANYEELVEGLEEEQLGRDASIRARQNRCKRVVFRGFADLARQ